MKRGRESAPRRERQVVRVLGTLKLLLEGGRPTVRDLALRFKTGRQTVYRDLHVLEEVGYPLTGEDDSGRLGGRPRLPAGRFAIPPLPLTRQEVAALVWAVKQTESRQPFQAALSTALPKLQALAPGHESRLAIALDGTVSGWERGVKDYRRFQPTIFRLVEAIVSRRQCQIEYRSPSRDRPRQFPYDAYRLLSIHGGVYCVGRVPAYPNFVTLAVDRIRSLEVTEEPFTVDPAFDPKRYEAEAFGVTWEKPMTVVVRFSADQAPYVREREWHPTQRLRDLPGGSLELTFRAGGMFEIMRWVVGWGNAAEVMRPAPLRREVASLLKRAAAIYGQRRMHPAHDREHAR